MEKEGKIVIIEGTSCVGKTTLCNKLSENGWEILPEAIRYLEKETGKIGDEASPIPGSQKEEEYYQDKLFEVEKNKIIEANELRKLGKNVVLDKSVLATIATAKAFEKQKGFKGTFKRAIKKYIKMVQELKEQGYIECDVFLLLKADYNRILERNLTRNHILDGIWIKEETIHEQREVLEKIVNNLMGNRSFDDIKVENLDTTELTKEEVEEYFYKIINEKERTKEEEIEL